MAAATSSVASVLSRPERLEAPSEVSSVPPSPSATTWKNCTSTVLAVSESHRRPKPSRLREREAGQPRPGEHQQHPQERQAHHHLRGEQDRHHPQHDGQHHHQEPFAQQIAVQDARNDVGEHRAACQIQGDPAERIFQVDEQAQEEQAEVRRPEGQQQTRQELRQRRVGQAQSAPHDDVVATDHDQAGQGQIDHRQEGIRPGDHRGVLIGVGGRRLGDDVERAMQAGH